MGVQKLELYSGSLHDAGVIGSYNEKLTGFEQEFGPADSQETCDTQTPFERHVGDADDAPRPTISGELNSELNKEIPFCRMISGDSFKRQISGDHFLSIQGVEDTGQEDPLSPKSDVPEILAPMPPTKQDDLYIMSIDDFEAQYKVQQEIGRGGYGVVSKGFARATQKPVAIKSLQFHSLEATNAYGKEMIVTWMMAHPNLVGLQNCFSDDLTLHLVMDYLSGRTVHDLVASRRKSNGEPRGLPGAQQEQFAWSMLCAVAYLHHHKIAHRDCKTENFMQESNCDTSSLKLIDFGLAKRVPRGEFLAEKVGTPEFAAPEVAKGRYNERCDIWSVGIVAFMICVGYLPFQGKTPIQVMKNVRDNEAKFAPDKWDLVKPRLMELVQNMLVKDPYVRTSAKNLADQNREWFTSVRQQAVTQKNDRQPKCCVIS